MTKRERMVRDPRINLFVKTAKEVLGDNVVSVVLFGSRSRGDCDDTWSDYDFLLIVKRPLIEEESLNLRLAIPPSMSYTLIARTKPFLRQALEMLSPVDMDAIYEGQLVYGDDIEGPRETLQRIVREYKLERKPELGKGVWRIGEPYPHGRPT